MNLVSSFIDELGIGSSQSFHNLTMHPLLADSSGKTDYLLLEQALEQDAIEVSEVDASGSVPNLKVLNKGAKRILLLDGEELIGAKQNRILNVTVMVPGNSKIIIPVSCVEAGRWSRQSDFFASAGRTHFYEGRARKAQQVNMSMRNSGRRHADQGEVWETISERADRMNARSPTAAADFIYETHRHSLDEYLKSFKPIKGQTGAVFSLNGKTAGVDVFDSPKVFKRSMKKLVESYALDAIDQSNGSQGEKSKKKSVRKFLESIVNSTLEIYPAVGEGQDCRFDAASITGGALAVDENVVHLCAFDIDEESSTDERVRPPRRQSRLTRSSARARSRRI